MVLYKEFAIFQNDKRQDFSLESRSDRGNFSVSYSILRVSCALSNCVGCCRVQDKTSSVGEECRFERSNITFTHLLTYISTQQVLQNLYKHSLGLTGKATGQVCREVTNSMHVVTCVLLSYTAHVSIGEGWLSPTIKACLLKSGELMQFSR